MRPKYVMVANDDCSDGPRVGLDAYPMLLEDFAKLFITSELQGPTCNGDPRRLVDRFRLAAKAPGQSHETSTVYEDAACVVEVWLRQK